MTHRNNHPQTTQPMPARMAGMSRLGFASKPNTVYSFVLVSLITVLPGAGFGNV
jgi:hypothetical protein